MKRLVVTILSISVLGIVGSAAASGAPSTRPPEAANPTLAAEVVNDIAVPLDILLYVQTEYQGFAVTGADKVARGGQQMYRLRVDRNDRANDGNSFYLLYDMSWKRLGEEKIAKPQQPEKTKKPEQPQQPTDKPKEEQDKPRNTTNDAEQNQDPPTTPEDTTEPTQPPAPTNEPGTPDNPTPTTTDNSRSSSN